MATTTVSFDLDGTTNTVDTDYTLYTVPNNNDATVDVIFCNRQASTATALKLQVVPNGETAGDEHYIEFAKALAAKVSYSVTGLTLGEGDSLVFSGSVASTSILVTGNYNPET